MTSTQQLQSAVENVSPRSNTATPEVVVTIPSPYSDFRGVAAAAPYEKNDLSYDGHPGHDDSHAGSEATLNEEDRELIQAAVAWIPSKPHMPVSSLKHLQAPVAIPQISKNLYGLSMPYMRAYSPELQSQGVEIDDFVAFIDNLNIVQAMYPPVFALDLFAIGIGMVPTPWTIGASFGAQAVARATNAIIARIRTRRYMERVNNEYFAPRGLKATLCKDDQLQQITSFPSTKRRVCSLRECENNPSLRTRRLKALEGYIAPLTTDVAAPVLPTNVIDKLSAKEVRWLINRGQKRETKAHGKQQLKEAKRAAKREATALKNTPASSNALSATTLRDLQDQMHKADQQKSAMQLEAEQGLLESRVMEKESAEIERQKENDSAPANSDIEEMPIDAEKQQQWQENAGAVTVLPTNLSQDLKREEKRARKDARSVSNLRWIVIQSI